VPVVDAGHARVNVSESLLNDVPRGAQAVQMSGGGAAEVVRRKGFYRLLSLV
jgi:hypothetical protein